VCSFVEMTWQFFKEKTNTWMFLPVSKLTYILDFCARGAAPANLLNNGRGTFSLSRLAMRSFPRKSLRISMRVSLGSTSILFIEALSAFLIPTRTKYLKRKVRGKKKYLLFFPMFSLTLAPLRSNGALAARHTPLGIGSSGRHGLNVSDVEKAGVGWRI